MMPTEKQDYDSDQRDQRQDVVVSTEQAPRRARVSPMDEFETTFHHHFFLSVTEKPEHDLFGGLVQRNHQQSNSCNAPIRSPQDGIQQSHFRDGGRFNPEIAQNTTHFAPNRRK